MQLIKRFIEFIIYSNIWIALGSICFCIESFILHQQSINYWYLCFLFSSTAVLYNAHRIIGLKVYIKNNGANRFNHILEYPTIIYLLSFSLAFLALYSFYQIRALVSYWMIVAIVASLLYVTPLLSKIRLRDLPFIKIFLIAVCWTILCYIIPIEEVDNALIVERFLFMIAITIPFDIRDIQTDKLANTKTLISLMGVRYSKALACFCAIIACALLLHYIFRNYGPGSRYLGFYVGFYLFCIFLILRTKTSNSDFYYSGIIDGLLVLRIALLLLS